MSFISGAHLFGFWTIGDGFGDDADVVDSRHAQSIDDGGEDAERYGFIAAKEDGVLRIFLLGFYFCAELVNIDGRISEIDELAFVDGDDNALLRALLDRVCFWHI